MTIYLTIAVLAMGLSFCLTPVVKRLALRWGLVDEPDGRRKTHLGTIPLGGGLAIAASMLLAVAIHACFFPDIVELYDESGSFHGNSRFLAGLFLSCGVLAIVGVLDDRFGLRGRQKLFGQLVAVTVLLVVSGMSITKLGMFGAVFDLGIVAIPFTIFWLLGAVNALNLMDGIDGLAATIGATAAFALAGMCLIGGRQVDAVVALALAGALIGFLRYNMPPATIFLGDTGSMLIGFLLGALALHSSLKGPTTVALAAPVAMLAIPILDSTAAILRRKLTGKSIYSTDRGHMHHVIMGKGYSNAATVGIIAVASIGTCAAALASVYWKNELLAGISVLVLILVLVASRIFGYAEYLLVRNRMLELGRSLIRPGRRDSEHRESSVQIQGSRDWNDLWRRLRAMVDSHVVRVGLDLDLPRLQEGFHARWERAGDHDESISLTQLFPVVVGGHVIGRLEVVGLLDAVDPETSQQAALKLLEFVRLEAAGLLDQEKRGSKPPRDLVAH
jgi:UDP-GlcNAc:undecaprenyl-phosphate/decaprenyl-phosphate GlcNAc-1-phosphate transferase